MRTFTLLPLNQHTGPKLSTYRADATANPVAVRFAHRSRLLTIRTVSQIEKAVKKMPKEESTAAVGNQRRSHTAARTTNNEPAVIARNVY